MAKAPQNIRLSTIARDAKLRAFFERAERDNGDAFAVPTERPRNLTGGAAERVRETVEA